MDLKAVHNCGFLPWVFFNISRVSSSAALRPTESPVAAWDFLESGSPAPTPAELDLKLAPRNIYW